MNGGRKHEAYGAVQSFCNGERIIEKKYSADKLETTHVEAKIRALDV
jgi:hypothetical protein